MTHAKPQTVEGLLRALEAWQEIVRQRGGHIHIGEERLAELTPEERAAWERAKARDRAPVALEEKH
jgi:hypothetical protein